MLAIRIVFSGVNRAFGRTGAAAPAGADRDRWGGEARPRVCVASGTYGAVRLSDRSDEVTVPSGSATADCIDGNGATDSRGDDSVSRGVVPTLDTVTRPSPKRWRIVSNRATPGRRDRTDLVSGGVTLPSTAPFVTDCDPVRWSDRRPACFASERNPALGLRMSGAVPIPVVLGDDTAQRSRIGGASRLGGPPGSRIDGDAAAGIET